MTIFLSPVSLPRSAITRHIKLALEKRVTKGKQYNFTGFIIYTLYSCLLAIIYRWIWFLVVSGIYSPSFLFPGSWRNLASRFQDTANCLCCLHCGFPTTTSFIVAYGVRSSPNAPLALYVTLVPSTPLITTPVQVLIIHDWIILCKTNLF